MSDILKQIQALQEQFSNLLGEELEKEGPKGEIKDLSRPPRKDYFDKKIEAAKTNFRNADKVARHKWKESNATDDIDSSGYSDTYADAMTANIEREKALDNYEYTKKDMNAARKGLAIEPKSTMEHIRRIRARRENATKMNDNNSYNEIVSQIMDLKEAFSNLFEVEGLGNPAVDVPPSQNKIKKDVKTKDGKAELVSVEDELFPYDGNKREQYRQKILDTINGMIQGTSTLEDLLQIVRQKKAPLKEAMEVLEELTKEDEKAAQKALDRHFDKVLYKPLKKQVNITRKAISTEKFKRENSEALEEAMELMEDLFSTILKQPDEKQGALVYKYHQAKNKENAGKDTYTQAKEEEKRKSKEEKGQEKTEQRKKYRGKSVEDWKLGRLMDQIARNAKNLGKVEDSATAKAVRRNAQKTDLKEALEIMEAIINEVSIDKWKEAAASSLPKRKEEAEAAKAAAEKGWEEYDKAARKSLEDEPALYRLAQANDEEAAKAEDKADHAYAVTRLQTHGKANANKAIKAAKKVQDKREDEFGRNPEKRTFLRSGKANQLAAADPVKSRNEADQ